MTNDTKFEQYMHDKQTANFRALKEAISIIVSTSVSAPIENNQITSDLIDSIMEDISACLENNGIHTCQPRIFRAGKVSYPCWEAPKDGILRSQCYYDECPFVRQLRQQKIDPESVLQPMSEDDKIYYDNTHNGSKETIMRIIDDEIRSINCMKFDPEEDENETSFRVKKMHWTAALKGLRLRIKEEMP